MMQLPTGAPCPQCGTGEGYQKNIWRWSLCGISDQALAMTKRMGRHCNQCGTEWDAYPKGCTPISPKPPGERVAPGVVRKPRTAQPSGGMSAAAASRQRWSCGTCGKTTASETRPKRCRCGATTRTYDGISRVAAQQVRRYTA